MSTTQKNLPVQTLIHLSSVTAYPLQGCEGAAANPSWHYAGWCTPWTSGLFITGLTYRDKQAFTLTFTPMGNVESAINLNCVSLDWRRRPQYPESTHADMGRTCKLHTDRFCLLWFYPSQKSNPGLPAVSAAFQSRPGRRKGKEKVRKWRKSCLCDALQSEIIVK